MSDAKLPEIDPKDRVRRRGATKKLFISYKREDIATVHPIVKRLNDEFYYDVWIDYDGIPGGSLWDEEIARGILEADAVLFMATPAACASEWCYAEIKRALELGKLIIPLKIAGKTTETDLEPIGLARHNWVDFVTPHPEPAWRKLLDALPQVLASNKRAFDPKFRSLRAKYLRSIYTEYGTMNLTYLLDAAPKHRVSLFDVYVPLKLGVSFNLEVQDGMMVDWWLRDLDSPQREEAEFVEKVKPKTLNGFDPQPVAIQAWEQILQEGWARYKHRHYGDQADKKENEREPLKDGTYYWHRIESETAPALQSHLVITGDPGSGKSTLLKHLALCMAGDILLQEREDARADLDSLEFWPWPAYTPLFIELRALVRTAFSSLDDEVTLVKFFEYVQTALLHPYDSDEFLPFLKDLMWEGEVMIFLDGLDEVPDAHDPKRRDQIKQLAHLLRDQYEKCRIVVTSRPYAYHAEDWQLNGFGHVNLTRLDEDRLKELAQKLFKVVLKVPDVVETQVTQFEEQIAEIDERLRSSPLFFTLMAALWLNRQDQPPETRVPIGEGAIYRDCVEMLILRWTRKDLDKRQSVAEVIGLNENQLRQVLEFLAFSVHSEQGDQDDALFTGGRISDAVLDLGFHCNETQLRVALAQRAGVVYEKSPNRFQFAHRSFQEHLSACYLTLPRHYPSLAVECLRRDPDLWRNVFRLLPDEAKRQTRDLWELLKKLLPDKKTPPPTDPYDRVWKLIAYAGRLFGEHLLPTADDRLEVYQPRLIDLLVKLIEVGALPPVERTEMGRLLARLGDPRPGIGLKDGKPDFGWIKLDGGTFPIGGDSEAWESLPAQEVRLEAFYIAKYVVTYAQYEAFVTGDGYRERQYWTEGGWRWKGDKIQPEVYWNDPEWHISNHPLVGVTWYEAYAFTQWASTTLGYEIRLLNEYEWERAARGKEGRLYAYGNEYDPMKANVDDTKIGRTSAVSLFPQGATPEGVFDLSGNVWEWTCTNWDTKELVDITSNSPHVLRGGAWISDRQLSRAASRFRISPDLRNDFSGFRVACSSLITEL